MPPISKPASAPSTFRSTSVGSILARYHDRGRHLGIGHLDEFRVKLVRHGARTGRISEEQSPAGMVVMAVSQKICVILSGRTPASAMFSSTGVASTGSGVDERRGAVALDEIMAASDGSETDGPPTRWTSAVIFMPLFFWRAPGEYSGDPVNVGRKLDGPVGVGAFDPVDGALMIIRP